MTPSFCVSGPHEITHWTNMMGSQRHAVAQWHSLHNRNHCDQVSDPNPRVAPLTANEKYIRFLAYQEKIM